MAPDAVELLIVEDNPHDLELALRALRQHNLANRVRVARDGAEALELLAVEFDEFVRAVSELGMYWLLLNHPPA